MPYLSILTNARVADVRHSELLAAAARVVAFQLSKPENYVMVSIAPGQRLAFAGSEEPTAFLELRSIGLPDAKRGSLCRELTISTESVIPELLADNISQRFLI